jgi:HAD superfamily hydrolase (TIGR01509 family)
MIKAVIFDMDGVISDTQKLHASVDEKLLRKHGINISASEITEKFSGMPTIEIFKKLFNEKKISVNIDFIMEEKWKRMMAYAKNDVSPISGSIELINKLKRQNFKLGIASSSPKNYVNVVLSKLKLKEKFDAVTTQEEVEHGKPKPDIHLLTAEKLDTLPKECVVIEDGISGMIAAKRAGMKSIAFIDKTRRKLGFDSRKYPADLIVSYLKEVNSEKIKRL